MTTDLSTLFPLLVDDEFALLARCVQLDGARVLDIGCGKGDTTRRMAVDGRAKQVTGIEVDAAQHEKNLAAPRPANVDFRLCGAEALDLPDASIDVVTLFKSLHHVPSQLMAQAFAEIHRVLRPGGGLYISEPVYDGPFNDLMRIFHDEGVVRAQASEAIASALKDRLFARERQVLFYSRIGFANFDEFRRKMMNVTHTDHRFSPELVARIEEAYEAHQSPLGAHFIRPMRVDVLVKG